MSYYDTLGAGPTATADDLQASYHRRALLLHPDRHSAGPPELLAEATKAMEELNAAYRVLSNPSDRAAYDRAISGSAPVAVDRRRTPRSNECVICGSSPAVSATFRQESGRLFWSVRRRSTGPFCRYCGLSLYRYLTNRTLMTGWWGVFAFFINIFTVIANVATSRRFYALSVPLDRSREVVAPASAPLDPGSPLSRRPGPYVALSVLLALGTWIGVAHVTAHDVSSVATSYVGQCVTGSGLEITGYVACSQIHNGKIVDAVTSSADCGSGDTYLALPNNEGVLCIDPNQ